VADLEQPHPEGGLRPQRELTGSGEDERPEQGLLAALGLAKGVWRIYFGGCETGARCTLPSGANVEDAFDGAPSRLRRRTITDPGGTRTVIDYAEWSGAGGVLHPRRIDMRAGETFRVEILVSGLERL